MGVASVGLVAGATTHWCLGCISLRARSRTLVGGALGNSQEVGAILHRSAECRLGTLNASLWPLPLCATILEPRLPATRRPMPFCLTSATRDLLHRCSHRSRHSDGIWVVTGTAFYPVAWRQESIKSLDQIRMSRKQLGYSVDNAGGVDPIACCQSNSASRARRNSRLALEIFHDVQESIVHIGLVVELNLDLVQVGEGILKRIEC